jgi:hypothetical protein
MLFIDSGNTRATLLINEAIEDGNLSKLFDQIKVEETGTDSIKLKSFQLSNQRFALSCKKAYFTHTPPSTSCSFMILAGDNGDDVNTMIVKLDGLKSETIETSARFSKEMDGIFPSDRAGKIYYSLKLENGVRLDVVGSGRGNLTIDFEAP